MPKGVVKVGREATAGRLTIEIGVVRAGQALSSGKITPVRYAAGGHINISRGGLDKGPMVFHWTSRIEAGFVDGRLIARGRTEKGNPFAHGGDKVGASPAVNPDLALALVDDAHVVGHLFEGA